MQTSCLICDRIRLIREETNPDFIVEMKTGYLVLGWHQFFKGYSIFFAKNHYEELYEMEAEERKGFLWEMSVVAEAISRAFKPSKMNYELLGNTDRHVHWHLFPRYADDPKPKRPVWEIDASITTSERVIPSPEERDRLIRMIRAELDKDGLNNL